MGVTETENANGINRRCTAALEMGIEEAYCGEIGSLSKGDGDDGHTNYQPLPTINLSAKEVFKGAGNKEATR